MRRKEIIWHLNGEGCWICTSHSTCRGYPVVNRDGRRWKIHRLMYEIHIGPIPEGMLVLHKCDNKLCINPYHLKIGTHTDNLEDRKRQNTYPSGEHGCFHKLTAQQVGEIRSKYRRGNGMKLAQEYDVDFSTIYYILRGDTWKLENYEPIRRNSQIAV